MATILFSELTSVSVGFTLKDLTTLFVAGLTIMIDRPFKLAFVLYVCIH